MIIQSTSRLSRRAAGVALAVMVIALSACAASRPVTPVDKSQAVNLIQDMENGIAEKIIHSTVADIAKADPEAGTRLGTGTQNDRWDSPDGADQAKRVEILDHYNTLMQRSADFKKLTTANKMQVKLLAYGASRAKQALAYKQYTSLISPVDGPQIRLPLLLITAQSATSIQDFKDYIARLKAFGPYIDQLLAVNQKRREAGILLPAAGMQDVAAECGALTTGTPFSDTGDPSPLKDDFDTKTRVAKIDADLRDTLDQEAANALLTVVGPACKALSGYAASIADTHSQGAGALPNGQAWYAERLAWFTSTDLTPDQVHALGVQQMSRILSEIEAVMRKDGISESPAQYMAHLRDDSKYRIKNDPDSLQKWLSKIGTYIFALDDTLGDMLAPRPDMDLDVRAMETFQQPSGETALYYRSPGLGIYYVNLTKIPDYEVEAITYRYSIPGQHVVPVSPLSTIIPIPAFTQGWSLYSVDLPSKQHYYTEPGTNLGRLLVTAEAISEALVDTGINAKHWGRHKATQYLLEHTPMSESQAASVVNRVLAAPGAATAALVGATTINRLRNKSEQALGSDFSLKAFNHEVLRYGPLPLPLLEQNINGWLQHQAEGKAPAPQ